MSANTTTSPDQMVGQQLIDNEGELIGTVERLILDHNTKDPEWLAVRLADGGRIVPVPLGGLSEASGDRLAFFRERTVVEEAPEVDLGETLDSKDEDLLYEHFGVVRPYIKEIAEAEGIEFTDDGRMLVPTGPQGSVGMPRPEGYPEDEWDISYGTSANLSIDEAFANAHVRLPHMEVTEGKVVEIGFRGAGIPGAGTTYVILAQRQSSPTTIALTGGEVDDLHEDTAPPT